MTETYDAVCLCAGHHSIPYSPKFEGETTFKGSLVHAQQYRDQKRFEGKRVVVVGIGNSAGDIASDLSGVCDQVSLHCHQLYMTLNKHTGYVSILKLFYLFFFVLDEHILVHNVH